MPEYFDNLDCTIRRENLTEQEADSVPKSDEGIPKISVESKESPSGLGEDVENEEPMIGVGSKESPPGLGEDVENDDPMIGVGSKESLTVTSLGNNGEKGRPIIGIEAEAPLDDEGDPKTRVHPNKLSDSTLGEADPVIDMETVSPMTGVESNEMLLDTHLSDNLGAPSEPRRSSRNAGLKSKPRLKVAAPSKLLSGKKKPACENDVVLLQVSASNK